MQFLPKNSKFLTPVIGAMLAIFIGFLVAMLTSRLAVFIVAALLLIALLPFYAYMVAWCEKLTFALTNKRLVCFSEKSHAIEWSLPLDSVSTIEVLDSTGGIPSVRFDLHDKRSVTVANVERAYDIKMMADTHR